MYLEVLHHEQRIETRAFATLGNFLVANAFVFATWATFFGRNRPGFDGIDFLLICLAVAGYVGGNAWAMLGARNWEYVRRMVAQLILIGGKHVAGSEEDVYQVLRGVEVSVHNAWKNKWKWGALSFHDTVLSGTPLVVALVYVLMLAVLLWEERLQVCSWEVPLWSILAFAIGVVGLVVTFARCRRSKKDARCAVRKARKDVGEDVCC